MFTFFKRKHSVSSAEDMGYDCAWLGLENSNPYVVHTPMWRAYDWGYNSALDDIKEWENASISCEDEYWPYTQIQ